MYEVFWNEKKQQRLTVNIDLTEIGDVWLTLDSRGSQPSIRANVAERKNRTLQAVDLEDAITCSSGRATTQFEFDIALMKGLTQLLQAAIEAQLDTQTTFRVITERLMGKGPGDWVKVVDHAR